jgi:hypothetical protein
MLHAHPPERKQEPGPPALERHHMWKRIAVVAGVLVVGYLVVAYFVLPIVWMRYTRHHPALADIPGITHTADGIPGDPLNVGQIGTQTDL